MEWTKKRIFTTCLLAASLLFLMGGTYALAESVRLEEESSLLADQYSLDRFNSYLSSNKGIWGVFTGDTIPNAISSLANIFFTGSKILFQVFDKCIELMYSLNVIDKLNDIVGTLTNNLWGDFKRSYIPLVVIISVLIVARTFFLESAKGALQQLAKVILVLVVAGIWFPSASEYMNKLNNYSFMFQASIMESASNTEATKGMTGGSVWKEDEEGNPVREVDSEKASEVATNVIRNELFRQTVYKPFLLLNYGTTKASDIDAMYQQAEDEELPKDTGGEYLLSDEFSQLTADEKETQITQLAGDDDDPINYYMTADSVGYKFVIALVYLVGVFLYGLPLVAIAFLNVLLQLLAIIYSYILPVIALLSLFPKYGNGLFNSILTISKIFMGKALLGLLVLMFALVNTSIDLLIPQDTMVNALLNLFVKGTIYLLAVKYRKSLVQAVVNALTGGNVTLREKAGRDGHGRLPQYQQDSYEYTRPSMADESLTDWQAPGERYMAMDNYDDYESLMEPQPPAPAMLALADSKPDGAYGHADAETIESLDISIDDPEVTIHDTTGTDTLQADPAEGPPGNDGADGNAMDRPPHQGYVTQNNTQNTDITDIEQTLTTPGESSNDKMAFREYLEELRG